MFSEKTSKDIDLIWKSLDREKIRAGYQLINDAVNEGDADAICLLGRCHLGSDYV